MIHEIVRTACQEELAEFLSTTATASLADAIATRAETALLASLSSTPKPVETQGRKPKSGRKAKSGRKPRAAHPRRESPLASPATTTATATDAESALAETAESALVGSAETESPLLQRKRHTVRESSRRTPTNSIL
jgi:hypothetical protein